jgi:hypothetical protein
VMVFHEPSTLADVNNMNPSEQVTDVAQRNILLGGSLKVGYGIGPLGATVGGSMAYSVQGTIAKDITHPAPNKVRVRYRVENGKTKTAAFGLNLGLTKMPNIPGVPSALTDKVAGAVTQVAQVGIQHEVDSLQENDSMLDVTIDLSTQEGQEAWARIQNDDCTEAQYWAGFSGSGVVLNKSMTTDLSAKTSKTDINLGPLTKENSTTWLDKQVDINKPADFKLDDAVDRTTANTALVPLLDSLFGRGQNNTMDIRLVHEIKAPNPPLPPVSSAPKTAAGTMTVRVPPPAQVQQGTLQDANALLGMRISLSDKDTSLATLEKRVNNAVTMMQQAGVPSASYQPLLQLQQDLASGKGVPKKAPIIPLIKVGDKRYQNTASDFEVFVPHEGFPNVFTDSTGTARTARDFATQFLSTTATLQGKSSLFSREGICQLLAKQYGGTCTPDNPGQDGSLYTLAPKNGPVVKLTASQLETLRASLMDWKPPPANMSGRGAGQGQWSFDFQIGGTPTQPLAKLHVDSWMWNQSSGDLKEAQAFGQQMAQVAQFYAANHPPARNPGESDAAYKARFQQYGTTSLYADPEKYFSTIDDYFRSLLGVEGKNPATVLTIAKMAGTQQIYARAEVDRPTALGGNVVTSFRGNNEAWDSKFDRMGFLRGQSQHLSAPAEAPNSWVLTGNS